MAIRGTINKIVSTFIPPSEPVTVVLELPHVTTAINLLKGVFDVPQNKYEAYDHLISIDPELAGAIDTKATFISKSLAGFTVLAGPQRTEQEEKLQQKLDIFHIFLRRYYYDIAYKVLKDGNACYLVQVDSKGITSLDYLPMSSLTCLENENQKDTLDAQVTKRGVYILSEKTDYEKSYPSNNVVHFDLGKSEIVKDTRGRVTVNIWNSSPLESLRAKLLWKSAIIINDMIWRERYVPREHHKLPSAQFSPDKFPGRTPKERMDAAVAAAKKAVEDYKNQIASAGDQQFPRPDQGYITLDNVMISTVETRLRHTDPNELIEQIDKSIYSVYCPESTVSGRGRAAYGTEAAVMMYVALKGERVAEAIAFVAVELAKKHLRTDTSNDFTDDDYARIVPRFNKILERHSLVRDAAILLESGSFTPTEVRRLVGAEPLSEQDKKEISEYREFLAATTRRYTESMKELSTTSKRATVPERPITPESESQQQVT